MRLLLIDIIILDLDGISYPATSNGQVNTVISFIADLRHTKGGKQQICFPNKGDKDGQVEICICILLKDDIRDDSEDDLIPFRDTHCNTTINLSEIFSYFEETKP